MIANDTLLGWIYFYLKLPKRLLGLINYYQVFNTTRNYLLNTIIFILFIIIAGIVFNFFNQNRFINMFGNNRFIDILNNNRRARYYYYLWCTIQYSYLFIGLTDCFRYDLNKNNYLLKSSIHDTFYLILLYIIFSFLLFCRFYYLDTNIKPNAIKDATNIIGIIFAATTISLGHYGKTNSISCISSVSCMLFILAVFVITQFGLYGCLIANYDHCYHYHDYPNE